MSSPVQHELDRPRHQASETIFPEAQEPRPTKLKNKYAGEQLAAAQNMATMAPIAQCVGPTSQSRARPRPTGNAKVKGQTKALVARSGSLSRSSSLESLHRPRGMVSHCSVVNAYEGKRSLVRVCYHLLSSLD